MHKCLFHYGSLASPLQEQVSRTAFFCFGGMARLKKTEKMTKMERQRRRRVAEQHMNLHKFRDIKEKHPQLSEI
eukprot:2238705-Ditylum_brightwellii.AAC.1